MKFVKFFIFMNHYAAFLCTIIPFNEKINFDATIEEIEPLFLTKYIESGKIDDGKKLSRVGPLPDGPNITSYSGFFTVNNKFNSNLFFWFFPALRAPITAPILLWLQGGPGSSSLFGLFVENGPFVLSKDLKPSLRNNTWAQEFSVIYIDQPVGAGFSFTDNDKGYATNEDDVARDLYEALRQFFTLFPEYRKNDFYITGESYAGKYVPAIAYKIHTEGSKADMNLKGIAIGNGACDPISMLKYGDFVYEIGLIDEYQRDSVNSEMKKVENLISNEKYTDALNVALKVTYNFMNFTGYSFPYNFLHSEAPEDFSYYHKFVTQSKIRNSIHVGNTTFDKEGTVLMHLFGDVMRSAKKTIEQLLNNNYKVLIYSGNLDIIMAAPLTENFLKTIKWKYSDEYPKAKRNIWKVSPNDKEIAGYVKNVHNLWRIIIRNAGHMVPYDQPIVAYDMIKRFINNKSY